MSNHQDEQLAFGNSKAIVSNQDDIHEKLEEVVKKHIAHPFQKPYQEHTVEAFEEIDRLVKAHGGEVILDACCGVGQSTRLLAKQNPQALVIGIDKSANRITRNVDEVAGDDGQQVNNYELVRADLNDFYRLVAKSGWPIKKHYILYPNPWPKSKHLQRRWHGSAVFPEILSIGETITLRSNWPLYLEEFHKAAEIGGRSGEISLVDDELPLTPFEAKYKASGQACWQLVIR